MTCIPVFLPVTRFDIYYERSTRRAITTLDKLVLRAIHNGCVSVAHLEALLHIDRRVVIECAVEHIRQGWLALQSSNEGFRLTKLGERVIRDNWTEIHLPEEPARAKVVQEELSGLVVSQPPPQVPRHLIDRNRILTGGNAISSPSFGVIERMLAPRLRRENAFLHQIIEVRRAQSDIYVRLLVDLASDDVFGLPPSFTELAPQIVEKAKQLAAADATYEPRPEDEVLRRQPRPQPNPATSHISCSIQPERDLLIGKSDHVAALRRALTNAVSFVCIVSAHVRAEAIREVAPLILACVKRGVSICVLWGLEQEDSSAAAIREAFASVKELLSTLPRTEKARFFHNEVATESDAKILIHDTRSGFEAVIGSFNWVFDLSMTAPDEGLDVSITLRDPRIVSEVCHSVLGSMADTSERKRFVPKQLAGIANALAQRQAAAEASDDAQCLVRIVMDKEHDKHLFHALRRFSKRCLLASAKINRIALGSDVSDGRLYGLRARVMKKRGEVLIKVGKKPAEDSWSESEEAKLADLMLEAGGKFVHQPGLHARLLICDDQVLITSFNFLSAPNFMGQMGVLISGPNVADRLWSRYGSSSNQ